MKMYNPPHPGEVLRGLCLKPPEALGQFRDVLVDPPLHAALNPVRELRNSVFQLSHRGQKLTLVSLEHDGAVPGDDMP